MRTGWDAHPPSICLLDLAALCIEEDFVSAGTEADTAVRGLQHRLGDDHPYTLAARMVLATVLAFRRLRSGPPIRTRPARDVRHAAGRPRSGGSDRKTRGACRRGRERSNPLKRPGFVWIEPMLATLTHERFSDPRGSSNVSSTASAVSPSAAAAPSACSRATRSRSTALIPKSPRPSKSRRPIPGRSTARWSRSKTPKPASRASNSACRRPRQARRYRRGRPRQLLRLRPHASGRQGHA